MKGSFDLQRGHDLQVENHYTIGPLSQLGSGSAGEETPWSVCAQVFYSALDLTVDKETLGVTLRRTTRTAMTMEQDLKSVKWASISKLAKYSSSGNGAVVLLHSHKKQHGKRLETHHEELNIAIKTSWHWIEWPGSLSWHSSLPRGLGANQQHWEETLRHKHWWLWWVQLGGAQLANSYGTQGLAVHLPTAAQQASRQLNGADWTQSGCS